MISMTNYFEGWRLKALVFSIFAAAAGYLCFSLWGGWGEVVEAFSRIGVAGTMLALAMSLVNYGLRFLRWQLYLARLDQFVAWFASFRIYISGFALTTTPGKAGEAFRSVLLKQRGVPFSVSLAAFVSERLSDLIAIVLLTLVGLSSYPQARPIVLVGVLGIGFVFFCISSKPLINKVYHWALSREGRFMKLVAHVCEMLKSARRCHSPGLLAVATCISVLAWGAEALAFHWVLNWLGADLSISFAIFVYAISMLAGALSFLPGGLGSAEAVMVSLLVVKGMAMPAAIAATVFIRLATLWFAVMLGLIALVMSRHGERGIKGGKA